MLKKKTKLLKNKKFVKSITETIGSMSSSILLFMAIVLLISGVCLFWIGFHNIDLAWNMKNLDCTYGYEFVDLGNDYVERDASTLYRLGLDQIIKAIAYLFSSGIGFGAIYLSFWTRK